MGADIHMVLEKRHTFEDGREAWVGVNAFPYATCAVYDFSRREKDPQAEVVSEGSVFWRPRGRNYELFAALAGVRGDGPEPRGMPDDMSDLARMEIEGWDSDGHSHTWYLMSEAMPLFLRHQFGGVDRMLKTGKSEEEIAYEAMGYFYESLYPDENTSLNDFRLIIWFDN